MQLHEKLHKSSSIANVTNLQVPINDKVNEKDSLFLMVEDFQLFDNYYYEPKVKSLDR